MIGFEVVENSVPDHMDRGENAVDMIVAFVALELEEQLGDHAPVGEDNDLADSFYTQRWGEEEYRVASSDPAADWVLQGTGEKRTGPGGTKGPIKPNTGKALKFYWRRAGAITVWNGDASNPEAFSRWALANGMVPFNAWPRGQKPQDYATPSMAEAAAKVPEIGHEAMLAARAVV